MTIPCTYGIHEEVLTFANQRFGKGLFVECRGRQEGGIQYCTVQYRQGDRVTVLDVCVSSTKTGRPVLLTIAFQQSFSDMTMTPCWQLAVGTHDP